MKRLGLFAFNLLAIGIIVFTIAACGDDPIPKPTVNFIAEVDGYDVAITVESTNATTFAWNYGDDNTSTEAGNHTYTYTQSGTYTIEVTVTNESGTATKSVDVDIAASMTELLAGASATGKVWVLDNGAGTNVQKINATFTPLWQALPANALFVFDLGVEYDNEYTFKPNGAFGMDVKNGAVLTGILYSLINQLEIIVPPSSSAAGLTGAAFTNATGEYVLHENTDLTLSVANEDFPDGTNNDGVTSVTFVGADYLTFTEGVFFGIQDYTTTVLIRNITATKMDVTFFLSTLDPQTYPASYGKPSIAISASVKVKP